MSFLKSTTSNSNDHQTKLETKIIRQEQETIVTLSEKIRVLRVGIIEQNQNISILQNQIQQLNKKNTSLCEKNETLVVMLRQSQQVIHERETQ
tara:strand:- start:399 stop:677 length:279 start_codon:yes stop_codon:yes gene_type:complete